MTCAVVQPQLKVQLEIQDEIPFSKEVKVKCWSECCKNKQLNNIIDRKK